MKGLHDQELQGPLGAESSPWLTANQKVETSIPQLQGTELCQGKRTPCSRKECCPVNTENAAL